MKTNAATVLLIVGILTWAGMRPASALDQRERGALENKVRGLRGMKTAEGKDAGYAEVEAALARLLGEHQGDSEALRIIRARFFWDVMRHYGREIGPDAMRAARDAYAALTDGLDEPGLLRHRIEAHRMLGEFDRDGYLAEADGLAKDVLAVKDANPGMAIDFLNSHMDRLWNWKMGPEALAAFTRLATELPEDGDASWKLYEKAGWFLRDYNERGPLENILAAIDPHRERIIAALDRERDAQRKTQRLGELLDRYASALLKANRADDALTLANQFVDSASDNPSARLLQAKCLQASGKTPEAVAAARSAILLAPENASAFSAQSFIADAALGAGDPDTALSEARLLFDVATDEKELGAAVQKIAKAMAARDGHLANANAFVLFQKSGPEAEGARSAAIPRKIDPAFAAEAAKAAESIDTGVSPALYRRKAAFLLYAGKPDDALAVLTRCYRILDTDGKSVEETIRCLAAAYRAKGGEALAAEPFLSYQEFGPAGPDGAPGNQDDMASPYPEIPPLGEDAVKTAEAKALEAVRANPASNAAVDALIEYGSVLSLAGRSDEALSAARAAYNAASDEKTLNRSVMAVASALRAQRGHVAVANDFILFQRFGAAGKDEQAGTADDLQDPLTGLALKLPESLAAELARMAAEREQANDPRGSGYLRLMLGDAKGALSAFKKDRLRMEFDDKSVARHAGDVLAAMKALYGHTFGGDGYVDFQRFGPAGRDGAAGTEDDLTDPLAGY